MLNGIRVFLAKISYLLQETGLGLQRGGWLNWAAVSTLMVLLFLVGTSLELSWGLDNAVQMLGSRLEISAYLEPDTKGSDLQSHVKQLPHVADVRVISKDEAWRDLLIDMGLQDEQTVEAQLGTQNPLVDALRVQADSSESLPEVAEVLKGVKGIDEIYYGSQVINQLAELQGLLRLGTLTVTGILTLTTVAVITTTIRLIVMARRREIEVMQLVGATNTWIYLPFILQGCIFGVIGAAGAWSLVLGSQQVFHDLLTQVIVLPFLQLPPTLSQSYFWILPGVLLGMGILLGTTSSLIAVSKSTLRYR